MLHGEPAAFGGNLKNKLTAIKNTRIMPFSGEMDSFDSGVFSNGECLPGSLLKRGRPAPLLPTQERLAGNYIFGGYLFGHFGHFLLESVSRLYAILQCPKLPVLFLSPNDQIFTSQIQMFKTLGVHNELVLLKTPTEVENLVYAEAGSCIDPPGASDEQLAALARFTTPAETDRKIWLSRSEFPGGGITNEKEIEEELRGRGWEILHPEKLSLQEQIRAVNASRYVAGLDGSAFFTTLLSRQTHGKFFIFGRRNHIPLEIPYLLERKNIPHELHIFPVEYVSGRGAARLYHMNDTRPVIEVLESCR